MEIFENPDQCLRCKSLQNASILKLGQMPRKGKEDWVFQKTKIAQHLLHNHI